MNTSKDNNREHARKVLTIANLRWQSFNHDNHWKIGEIDFWPTTWRWIDNKADFRSEGVFELIEHIRTKYPMMIYTPSNKNLMKLLSVEQLFEIAKKVRPMNLEKVCESLHKEIYG